MTSSFCRSVLRVLFFFLIGSAGHTYGANTGVLVYWDNAPANESIAQYRIFYGTHTGLYTNSLIVYDPSGTVITGLAPATYYFAVMATDTNGLNSPLSSEVSVTLSVVKPVVLQTQIYTDGNGVPYGMYITGTNSTTVDWELDSSPDMKHWSYVTGDHGVDITDFEYFDPTIGQMFYRVVDNQ